MLNELFSLKGKRVLVTGSSRGIGRSIALLFGEAGAHVIFHGSRPSPKLDTAYDEAVKRSLDVEKITADIADDAELEKLIAACGQIDILVLNASVQRYMPVEEFDGAEFDREYRTNVRASFRLISAFLTGMKERHFGRIITIGSVNQWKQSPNLPVYASTKSAQANLMMSCARKYASFGITANNIAPGVIATDRNAAVLSDPAKVEMLLKGIPCGRFGTADDCAGLALLLASDAGSYITGADIPVTGGMHL